MILIVSKLILNWTKVLVPLCFIVDRDLSLRGRDDDEDIGMLYGLTQSCRN